MFFKVLNSALNHNDFQYVIGLNIDTNPFNDKECENGLHFCESKDVYLWLSYGSKLAFISIPNDAKVIHFWNKSKADRIFIEKIIDLKDWEMWENKEFCIEAIKLNKNSLEFIKNQNNDLCLEAVKCNGSDLKYIINQTEEMCFEAVKQNGNALEYIINQTEEMCFEAVKQNGNALQFVVNQTDDVCLQAVKQNGHALQYVKNQTEEICLEASKHKKNVLEIITYSQSINFTVVHEGIRSFGSLFGYL
jgi:hypothetical protein